MSAEGSGSSGGELVVSGRKFSGSLTFDMAEKSLVKAMEEITDQSVRDFVSSLEVIQSDQMDVVFMSVFEFMGFDPRQVIKKLILINKHYRESQKISEETVDVLKQDVMLMIAANIYMGNLQTKSQSRRSANARTILNYLIKKYGMKVGTTGAGMQADILTFPRVANSFPVVTLRMSMVLPTKDFQNGKFKTMRLPKFCRVSSFASICPVEMSARTRTFLLQSVCAYSCDQSVVVSEGEARKPENKQKKLKLLTPTEAYGLQWNYIFVASNSPVPTFKMKKAMHKELETSTKYREFLPAVKALRDIIKDESPIPTEEEFKSDISDFMNKAKKGEEGTVVPEVPKVEEVDDDE